MPSFDHLVEVDINETIQTMKLCALFDVPKQERSRISWHVDMPFEDRKWNIGLIVGPSGCGKTQIASKIWDIAGELDWPKKCAVIDAFPPTISVDEVSRLCSAVGFNTVPAWLRPYHVLSNGEKFRVSIARHLAMLTKNDICVIDEFTSVVDRQVAQITSHAVQKYVRSHGLSFVAVTCHYDIIDWLQPDWIYEPASNWFEWRSLQRRPSIDCEVRRVEMGAWRLFAPYHYLSAELSKEAACFAAFINGQPVSFTGVVHRPYRKRLLPLFAMQRSVTLPDWQGSGIIFHLNRIIGGAYRALGARIRAYPSHHALVKSLNASPDWVLIKKPGVETRSKSKLIELRRKYGRKTNKVMGLRPRAIFEYCGPLLATNDAFELLKDQQWVVRQRDHYALPQRVECDNKECVGGLCKYEKCIAG